MKQKILHSTLIFSVILTFLIFKLFPYATENIYSRNIFLLIVKTQTLITGCLPFSLIEVLIITLILSLIILFTKKLVQKNLKLSLNKNLVKNFIIKMLIFSLIFYFSFLNLWGYNYNRYKFKNTDLNKYKMNELISLCEYLANETNLLRRNVTEDKEGIMTLSTPLSNTLKRASYGYEILAESDNRFNKNFGYPKSIYFSKVLMYLGISGFYSPLTGEANINKYTPNCYIPHTTCHEMAHQFGFAREYEANYISFIACKNSKYDDYKYSGYISMLIYTMNSLYEVNQDEFYEIKKTYSPGLLRDLTDINKTYQSYDTKIEDISNKLNDTYLKANQQKNGINSYNDVIYLLIQDYKNKSI